MASLEMRFQFATAGAIEFGVGAINSLPNYTRDLGSRVLVVCGHDDSRARIVFDLLPEAADAPVFCVAGEPTLERIEQGVRLAKDYGADSVVGIGGGSVIDAAKAIAALVRSPGPAVEYLEVVGAGRPLANPAAPCIAVPTTAGTGAEVTRNSVITVPEARIKVSLRHVSMLPRAAIVDPKLTLSVPPDVTAATGCDALTQVIEPFVSRYSTPLTDSLCRDAIQRARTALPRTCNDGANLDSRVEMALVSLYGGLALANAKLGVVHGFAGVLGGRYPVAHGTLCATLLAPSMEANIRALRARAPSSPFLARFEEIARLLVGSDTVHAEDGAAWIRHLVESLGIPRLGALGIDQSAFDELVELSSRSSSMKGNPIDLEPSELRWILQRAS